MRWPPVVACAAGASLCPRAGVAGIASQPAAPLTRPDVVLMFLGWGEVNVYGGVRGAITPRLDRLAAEGLRLDTFNVEFSCTVARAALLTRTRSCCGKSRADRWRRRHRQRRRRPWSGFYSSVMEGGIRTPCLVRWPGRIPAGRDVKDANPWVKSVVDRIVNEFGATSATRSVCRKQLP